MKYFLVIGLGSFGYHMVKALSEKGMDVAAIDRDRAKIDSVKDFAVKAAIVDAVGPEVLKKFAAQEAAAVVVAVGPRTEDSIFIVHLLKEMGVKRIIAKANSEAHAQILAIVGAEEVILPEKDTAVRVASHLVDVNVLDYLPLSGGYSIQKIVPPEKFVGRSIRELDLRNLHDIHVIAVRHSGGPEALVIPRADYVIKKDDLLVVIGDEKSLEKIARG
ncbi:MAG: TrkA family potassium uptake protein [Acidobacteria bacterium]|nr:TrkA family potassium uptake protein [Acidobacteriota bacterium]MBU4307115.1 TrkA family potassium uptake protein [Acidobacteriota bacterium]MCG2812638.1 TrkA family potassium uptake protein [Candidatus Aminicenantes bacterium]